MTTTDASGAFAIDGFLPGRYRVALHDPNGKYVADLGVVDAPGDDVVLVDPGPAPASGR